MQNSGRTCREIADIRSVVVPATGSAEWPPDDRLRRGSSIPETAVIEPRSRGVLDPPPSRGMTISDGGEAPRNLPLEPL
jgi:hypothetical protein